ncbi:MAG TPA: hypothetical protein DCX60_05520 [Phycisphaerales bacterium]|nr:hypothetical protein [Phycisphaerales bacterium]
MTSPSSRTTRLIGMAASLMLVGCLDSGGEPEMLEPRWRPAPQASPTDVVDAPVAYWKPIGTDGRGRPLGRSRLEGMLMESAGPQALREALLDATLEERLDELNLTITEEDMLLERMTLLTTLDEDEDRATRLLETIRRREGLGPLRFSALLRRNAGLRKLVEDDVRPNEEAVRAAWDVRHGPRRVARVFVAPTLDGCSEVIAKVEAGEEFETLAAMKSTDASASVGGLLEPISRLDPSWPTSFRETLWTTPLGEISSPVLVDADYVLILPMEEVSGDEVTFEMDREDAARRVRLAQERLLMDALARDLLDSVQVDIIDGDLDRAWRTPAP